MLPRSLFSSSLFGEKFYKNAQDQTTSKFYDDGEWHYVAYVATNGLKTVTLFVDGEECGTMDMTTLGNGLQDFEEEGDFSGRTFYLRNIVLGGFTPHGLFFQKQYYEDAALAFDDIAIYSRALTADQIYDIICSYIGYYCSDEIKRYDVEASFCLKLRSCGDYQLENQHYAVNYHQRAHTERHEPCKAAALVVAV